MQWNQYKLIKFQKSDNFSSNFQKIIINLNSCGLLAVSWRGHKADSWSIENILVIEYTTWNLQKLYTHSYYQ